MKRSAWCLLGLALLAAPAAQAEVQHEVFGALAGGVWPSPNAGGHGIAIVEWRARRAPGAGSFTATLNTDTLRLRFDDLCADWLCFGVELTGEALIAGLLTDHYRRGERFSELEFNASYIAASVFAEARLPASWFLRYTATGRRWFFSDPQPYLGTAAEAPPEAWVGEQALALTYWQLAPDVSQWEPHRLFMRVRGLALGARAELHVRSEARRWGESAIAGQRMDRGTGTIDPFARTFGSDRNDPSQVIVFVRQWARYGSQVTPWLRLQLEEQLGWGWGEDDLTRARIGGLNPYVVPVGGVPWAAFLSGRYVSGRVSAHVRVWEQIEVGAFFDAVTMPGIFRDGSERFGGAVGAGGFLDARFGAWQVDVWLAAAPGLRWGTDSVYVAAFVSGGLRF